MNRSQLQMFSLAPLTLLKPCVAVLDEPLENLSSLMASEALSMILALLDRAAVLALVQNKSQLVTRADRVVVLQ